MGQVEEIEDCLTGAELGKFYIMYVHVLAKASLSPTKQIIYDYNRCGYTRPLAHGEPWGYGLGWVYPGL